MDDRIKVIKSSNAKTLRQAYKHIRMKSNLTDTHKINLFESYIFHDTLRQILKINYDKAAQKQLLGYDTEFQLDCSWIFIRDFR